MQADEKLSSYLAGTMSEGERLAFEMSMLDDPGTRRELVEQQRISAALRAMLAPDKDRMVQSILAVTRGAPAGMLKRKSNVIPRAPRRLSPWLAAAAAIVLLGLILHLARPPHVVTVTRSIAAVWDDPAPEAGKGFPPRTLVLQRGAVELEFSSGAKGILEGPARLRLISGKEVDLSEGRLRVSVPPEAHGFTVRGKDFAAVDLGTEFGVIAGAVPEVHVFEGKVEFQGTSKKLLAGSEAVRVSRDTIEGIPATRGLFADEHRLAAIQASADIDRHPSAVVHYDFLPEKGSLPNRVAGEHGLAKISGCREAEGRWPGRAALEFSRPDDAVSFSLPAALPSASLIAWVKVDDLPNRQCSLLMGSSELPGDMHWYLHQEGSVNFAVIGPDGKWRLSDSALVIQKSDMGKWRCFGVTFDGTTGKTTLYLDGKALSGSSLGSGCQLNPGEILIGNWAHRKGSALRASKQYENLPGNFRRNLKGRIDELAVFSSVLGPDEIRALYEQGKP